MTPKGDHRIILATLRKAIQKRCVQKFVRDSKIGSTTIYSATSPVDGNPSLCTLVRIVNALGYQLIVRPKKSAKPSEHMAKAPLALTGHAHG